MEGPIAQSLRARRLNLVSEDAVPQLNKAEREELIDFLV